MLGCFAATQTILTYGLILAIGLDVTRGIILPPHWANETINPCARKSWQMLHWSEDKKCYNIFSQGPCGETQEIFFDSSTGVAACRCSRGSAWHATSQRCYQIYSKGPCKYREYFKLKDEDPDNKQHNSEGGCIKYEECPPGQLYWPPTSQCFSHLSRGPCLHGHLLHIDPSTGSTKCGCDATLMSTNFWPHGDTCHELFTRGPCIQGHIFLYNLTSWQSECVCNPSLLTNYHPPTGRCYEVKTLGPCRQGQQFIFDPGSNKAKCACLEGYVEWHQTGQCYRIYTRGPCSPDHFLQIDERSLAGECVKSSCTKGELYDPSTNACYPVGRRGPCPQGKLWVFERATSFQGSCQCDPHLIGYWAQHGICYELGEMGPCPKRRILTYDKQTGELKCRCDLRKGYVPWVNGRCIIAGVKKDKLIPVAAPSGDFERGNSIHSERIHRGLTLPSTSEEKVRNSTRLRPYKNNIPTTIQEEILKDILNTIHNVSFTKTSTSISAEISRESIPSVSMEVSAKNILQTSARRSTSDHPQLPEQVGNAPIVKKTSAGGINQKEPPKRNILEMTANTKVNAAAKEETDNKENKKDDIGNKEQHIVNKQKATLTILEDDINERLRKKLEEIRKRREGLQTTRVTDLSKRKPPTSDSFAKFYNRRNQERTGAQTSAKTIDRRTVPLFMRRGRELRS